MSPAGTLVFDIFSPPSGDSDVISQVERLSSNEMNIAPRSLRIAFGASGRSATVCMAVSRVGDRNLTLPERRSLSTSPWDLEAEILTLRHQLNVLRRKSPKRPAFSNFDPLIFACLYRISPRIVNALVIVKPETVIRWHGAGFRFFWRWKSRSRGGRPKVPLEIRQLIREMSLANPLWGAPRIHGELLKLGIDVGQTSVAKYMARQKKPTSQGWKTLSAPKQHNSREDNETIKEGETPEDWKSKPAKNRQKDKDARWTKKHERSYFGYKNHIGVDRRHKFVRRYVVSDASVHDSQKFEDVLDTSNTASIANSVRRRRPPIRRARRCAPASSMY